MDCLLKNCLESCLDLDYFLIGRWKTCCLVLMPMAEASEQANDQVVRAFDGVADWLAEDQ